MGSLINNLVERNGELKVKPVEVNGVLTSRYPPDAQLSIDAYFNEHGNEPHSARQLFSGFLTQATDPSLEKQSKMWPKYTIPEEVLANNSFTRAFTLIKAEELFDKLNNTENDLNLVREFFIANHEWIKFALNQWLLASPGMALEIYNIPQRLQTNFKEWLLANFNAK